MKRAVDFFIAFLGLLFSAPLWIMIITAIKLDSKGSVLYSQERYGKDGKVFKQLKLRSMIQDAGKKQPVRFLHVKGIPGSTRRLGFKENSYG